MQADAHLPPPLQDRISLLDPGMVLPLGLEEGEPMLLLRLDDADEALLGDAELACEYKPTIMLLPFEGKTVGLCIVQFRLNGDDRHIYTTFYDIAEPKMYDAADALLKMMRYNVVIATSASHRLKSFSANFVGTFNPQLVLQQAKDAAQNRAGDGLADIVFQGMTGQFETPFALWRSLEQIAPPHKKWLLKL
jgi:hypothetical protein